jgi:hypothetical protein
VTAAAAIQIRPFIMPLRLFSEARRVLWSLWSLLPRSSAADPAGASAPADVASMLFRTVTEPRLAASSARIFRVVTVIGKRRIFAPQPRPTGLLRVAVLTTSLRLWVPHASTAVWRARCACHQTVIISCPRPFFDALILHLSENIGAIACRARYWETRRDRPDGDVG